MENIYKITKSMIILIFCLPTTLLAFVNVSFIPTTSGSTLNLVATQNTTVSTNLDLELHSLTNNQFTQEGATVTRVSGLNNPNSVTNAVVLPLSLSNNQITDKIIVIPLGAANIFSTIHVLNADLSNPQSINVQGTPTLSTTPILISNNSGVFFIIGTSSTLRIYRLNPTDNTLAPDSTNTYNVQNIERILPIDENIIAVILRAPLSNEISADIRSIITNTSMDEFDNLGLTNDIEILYNTGSFQTSIVSSSATLANISAAPSPYGVNKVFSQS